MSIERNVDGLQVVQTDRSVAEVMDRLQALALARGLTVFGRINFSADAKRSGLELSPTELIMVGNPKAGTPLIAVAPTVAIDLPLRVLAWTDAKGKTHLAFNDPDYLQKRHGFPPDLMKNIGGLAALATEAAGGDDRGR
jgi:uncharacterized protein (DUF302 family)